MRGSLLLLAPLLCVFFAWGELSPFPDLRKGPARKRLCTAPAGRSMNYWCCTGDLVTVESDVLHRLTRRTRGRVHG